MRSLQEFQNTLSDASETAKTALRSRRTFPADSALQGNVRCDHSACQSCEAGAITLGVQQGHKGPCNDSTVAALMRTPPCSVSG